MLFYELEEKGKSNIEKFMEFVWHNRSRKFELDPDRIVPGYISGARPFTPGTPAEDAISTAGGFWEDLLFHGIGSPIGSFMLQSFHENGVGWRDLRLSKSIAERLQPSDLILNLNYDTVFELALIQSGRPFTYSPQPIPSGHLAVCKPHGSLNLMTNNTHLQFGSPQWLGIMGPPPPGFRSFSGLVPPRMNKNYAQHPVSKAILAPVRNRRPKTIIMWGIGLTESDADLISLYSRWARKAEVIDVINPDSEIAKRAAKLFRCEVRHFRDVSHWKDNGQEGDSVPSKRLSRLLPA